MVPATHSVSVIKIYHISERSFVVAILTEVAITGAAVGIVDESGIRKCFCICVTICNYACVTYSFCNLNDLILNLKSLK